MAGGNKKKKKPVANPARGFATTSTASKAQIEAVEAQDTTPTTPSKPAPSARKTDAAISQADVKPAVERELHELTPEQLEAQLELSDLQRIVDQYGAKVHKEASRTASRIQTDKRLLRGQSDFFSAREWLPEEIIEQILDYARQDEVETPRKHSLHGDELLSKSWQLHESLVELGFESEQAKDAIMYLTSHSSWSDAVSDAFEWLALHRHNDLVDYDTMQSRKTAGLIETEEETADPIDTPQNTSPPRESAREDDIQVSDLDSDLEPDALLETYLNTKARLFVIDPTFDERPNKKDPPKPPSTPGQRKLRQKLAKIRSDMLFDLQTAEMQWASRKIELKREQAERRKLKLDEEDSPKADAAQGVNDEAERIAQELLQESNDDMLSGMFDALPTVSNAQSTPDVDASQITVRDFGKLSGLSPKRVLEEACKARDSKSSVTYKMISPTTYLCRHSVTIRWSREMDVEASALDAVESKRRISSFIVDMTKVAATDVAQSEAYVATAALFLLFSESPTEAKAHLRLPPAYRDLWREFQQEKQASDEAHDRETVKSLRELLDQQAPTFADDDEIVYNPAQRKANGSSNGTNTPVVYQNLGNGQPSQALIDLWRAKTETPAFQAMQQVRANLPMFAFRDAALDIITRHQITILCGETGCGKSTQLPAFILEHQLSNGKDCKIYCTEPRRISAISLAQRVSEEMGERKGDVGTNRSLVGYAIRLESQTSASTKLVYATVGIVLRMLENADGIKDITHLILDEVHERSIDTDFLLIILRSLMLKRPDLKVVLMSATVDAQRFANYFDGAPIITVPGRTYPVSAYFLEDAIEVTGHVVEDNDRGGNNDDDDFEVTDNSRGGDLSAYSKQTRSTLAVYDEYRIDYVLIIRLLEKIAEDVRYADFSKAVLVFLPGIAEIRQLNDMLGGHPSFSRGWYVYPLHSSFSSEDQQAAFEVPPHGIRKIVLATNIAETGITIPDVTCVIDTGKHKEMRFDERRQMSRLIQSFIARANAKQRRGRAGRVQEGICFHLFTKFRHDTLMIDQQTPEMLRLSLQDLVMRVKICKLGDIEGVLTQALDPPAGKNIRRAIDALIEVDALTNDEELTPLGRQLAKLPVDAQLGKLLLFGSTYGCLDFTLTVAAALSGKSPFLSPMHAKKQADIVRLGYKRGDSDLLTLYNAYTTWRKVCQTPGMSEYQFCNKNFLSVQNLGNIEDLKAQLLASLIDAGFVTLSHDDKAVLAKMRRNGNHKHFVQMPHAYCRFDEHDEIANSVVAWSFYPKLLRREGKGWRNIANNQSLGLHPTSVNKLNTNNDIKNLSFYSIMQTSARFTNAQETSPVSDYALILSAGEAVCNMFAGVIIIDGNRLKFKVHSWKIMVALKVLRAKFRECQSRALRYPGKELDAKLRRWVSLHDMILTKARIDR